MRGHNHRGGKLFEGMLFDWVETWATHEPGDDQEEIPTSQKITIRENSAAELVKQTSCFKQKGLRKGGYLGFMTVGY